MRNTKFTIENLGDLDGGYTARVIDGQIRRAVADCFDRCEDASKRTVRVLLHFTPVAQGSVCIGINVVPEVGPVKIPSVVCAGAVMEVGEGNTLLFNPLSVEAPRQHTLDEIGAEGE